MATTKKTTKKANKVTDTSYDRFSAGDGAFFVVFFVVAIFLFLLK